MPRKADISMTTKAKRLILMMLTIVSVLTEVHAQDHMEYMGISMNQTIDSFAVALQDKGYKLSPASQKAPKGKRLFVGSFGEDKVNLTVSYGVHTHYVTDVAVDFPEEKDLQKFMLFYEAMKRVITEAYCTDGEVVNEMGSMDVLPTYGMSMDYGKVIISINPKKNYGLIVTYTDQVNTVEERKLRYDPVE